MLAFPSGCRLAFPATDPASVSYRSDPNTKWERSSLNERITKVWRVGSSADKAATVLLPDLLGIDRLHTHSLCRLSYFDFG